MDLMSTLEKRFGGWAIPSLTLYLMVIQAIGVALLMGSYADYQDLVLVGGLVKAGQWTRLLSFMMIPKTLSPIWLFFAFYLFYLTGSALEQQWGAFRYNLFVISSYLLNVAVAFVFPSAWVSNYFFIGAVFLAFATLFPKFTLNIFLVLPVQVRWIGLVTAIFYALILIGAVRISIHPDEVLGDRLGVLSALLVYAIFFGKDFLNNFKAGQRRKAFVAERVVADSQPRHVCAECGVSDKSDDALHFRYCSTCGKCFCEEHIGNHGH
jgi:hypothetical protein